MAWYRLKLEQDGDTLLVTSPDFPELTSFGDDVDDALRHGRDALEEAIAARITQSLDVPHPRERRGKGHFVEVPALARLKVALYRACRETGVTRAELMRRLGWHREQVDRLFRLDHHSRLDQLEAAFHALGLRMAISLTGDAA